ncbi:uncharacterized protein LOC129588351 isoform X2 [Paramacrobiotus metropolitanus]|uniref:uncharacterized protein LOC129588351 isoform X2 n=1 Tax=Paramacrobiotus metropolitanus TaxID=2943436 RepID=UPI002445880A|nr:uncharacterized protein LOC129588351 isoform X2 [Paramacrobiotus metropolitanus]
MEMSEITAHRNNDKDVTKCLEQVDLQKRQPCSTANRMLQTLCENIVWNICEHYHGILKQNQTRSSGTAPVPVMAVVQHGDTNAAEVCHVRTLTNESITAQLLADAEASVADQARQYNEIMDLFKKKEDVQDPTSANEIIDWRGNYLEQHEVLAVTMEYNAKLQMALVSANGHIANLKKQLDKVEQSQQTLTYETMQEGKDKPSLFSTQWADRGILKGHERAIDRESQTDPVLPVKLKEKEKRTAKTINDMKKKLTAKERERRILVDALERSNAEIAVIKKQSTVADSEISGLKSALANVERKGQLMNESTSPESTKKINLLEEQVAKLQNMLKTERDNKQFRETISKPLETGVRVEELKRNSMPKSPRLMTSKML